MLLTQELLRARTVALFQRCADAAGPVEEIIFEVIRCDGCGRTVNLMTEGHPDGWTTEGDMDSGWRDLCEACSPFTCPQCGMTSQHPKDREHDYCGNCHDFTAMGLGGG